MSAGSYSILPIELAGLLGGMSWWCDTGCKSSTTCPHHGPPVADLGLDTMVEVGAFSINLYHHQIPTRKENVVANALSKSQRKLEEGSMDELATTSAVIEVQIATLSGVSTE